ncbi:MAG TPA: hypothetical protein VIM00_06395 [Candidatus Acidoferrum sp.]
MTAGRQKTLDLLKRELEFVEKGGYKNPLRAAWRPRFLFQDSPSCLNYDVSQHPRPCSDCFLAQFVPKDAQHHNAACRFIPLNEQGLTLDLLYRSGTHQEIETAFVDWLKSTIARLEREQATALRNSDYPEIHVHGTFVSGC